MAIITVQLALSEVLPDGRRIYWASLAVVLILGGNHACNLKSEGIAVGTYRPCWVVTDMGGGSEDSTAGASRVTSH